MPRLRLMLVRILRPQTWRVRRQLSTPSRVDLDLDLPALGGPGWFDSSWDLTQGLRMREGLPSDARLDEWIEATLRA